MFIVIEGTDASGKTSLSEAVKHELEMRQHGFPIQTFHKGRPLEETRRWVLKDYVTSIEDVDWTSCIAMSDRWHWGEITYAPLKRPHTNLDGYGLLSKAGWRWTELFLMSRGIAQFWLYQPLHVIQERINSRGDDFVNADELETILGQYEFAASQSCIIEKLCPPANSLDQVTDLANYIIDRSSEVSFEASSISGFPGYIGSPNPKALLVGDVRNIVAKYGEETKLPFMPVDGNSGEYLLNALPDDFWKTVGIINVNDVPNIGGTIYDLWILLGRPNIIALGRLASRGLEREGFSNDLFTTMPHPQYVRRFHNKDQQEYGTAIQRNAQNKPTEDRWILR